MTTKTKISYDELKSNLEQHIMSENYYKLSPFTPIVATDGVKYFADTCECYWLLDLICFNIYKLHRELGTLFIHVDVNKRGTCHITVDEDLGEPILFEKKQRDLCQIIPVGKYEFYLIDNVLLLPSEY